ncbi:hypothetical protein Tco_0872199 [Tanacetum coccineum]
MGASSTLVYSPGPSNLQAILQDLQHLKSILQTFKKCRVLKSQALAWKDNGKYEPVGSGQEIEDKSIKVDKLGSSGSVLDLDDELVVVVDLELKLEDLEDRKERNGRGREEKESEKGIVRQEARGRRNFLVYKDMCTVGIMYWFRYVDWESGSGKVNGYSEKVRGEIKVEGEVSVKMNVEEGKVRRDGKDDKRRIGIQGKELLFLAKLLCKRNGRDGFWDKCVRKISKMNDEIFLGDVGKRRKKMGGWGRGGERGINGGERGKGTGECVVKGSSLFVVKKSGSCKLV